MYIALRDKDAFFVFLESCCHRFNWRQITEKLDIIEQK